MGDDGFHLVLDRAAASVSSQLVRELGFQDVAHVGPDEARERSFPGRSDVEFGGAPRLLVATVP